VFFNATRLTVEGLTGYVFRKDPVLGEDVPPAIVAHWENIDNAGTHGDVFCREQFTDALNVGHGAILVEFPKTGGTQTPLEERVTGEIRPYWVPIKKDDVVSWRTTVEHGKTILTQLVVRETGVLSDGAFGEKEQTRYRVFYRNQTASGPVVGFVLLEETDNREVIQVDEGLYPTQDEIPVAEIGTSGRKGLFESDPPLLDLAFLNIAHYQQQSDHFTNIHLTCVPVPVTIGADTTQGQVVLGPNAGLHLPQGGDFKYVSAPADAIGPTKQSLDDLKADMATAGLAMLAADKRAAETAQAKRIDKAASDSKLAVSARGLQDAIERALGFHARYLGLELEAGGSITINRDYENLTLDAGMIAALSGLVREGQLTLETLWKMLQEGNTLPEDFDADEEKGLLDAEAEIKRQQALAIADQQARAQKGPEQMPPGSGPLHEHSPAALSSIASAMIAMRDAGSASAG
jgi:hypothetical protein